MLGISVQICSCKAGDEELNEPASSANPEDRIIGKHVYGNLYGLDTAVINDEQMLKSVMLEAVGLAKMNLIEIRSWSLGGMKGGISVIALIEESHCVLHTWNEYNYATLDIYTCGERSDPKVAFDHVVAKLKPKTHQVFSADRSQLELLKQQGPGF